MLKILKTFYKKNFFSDLQCFTILLYALENDGVKE